MKPDLSLLDALVPLDGATFGDAVKLGVDVPTRYAQCYVVLGDGAEARLRDRSQLLGWSQNGRRRNFFFSCADGGILRVRTNGARRRTIRAIERWDEAVLSRALSSRDPEVRAMSGRIYKFTSVDGGLCFVARRPSRAAAAARPQRVRELAANLAPSLASATTE